MVEKQASELWAPISVPPGPVGPIDTRGCECACRYTRVCINAGTYDEHTEVQRELDPRCPVHGGDA